MAGGRLDGLRVAIYARFSSEHQRDASIDDQVRRCRAFAEEHGAAISDGLIFADRAMSGTSMNRPALKEMMELATRRPRAVDAIIVEDLSRLGRDESDLFNMKKLLEFAEVALIGVADGIDTEAAHSNMTFAVKTLVSSLYSRELSDKTTRGLKGRALSGYSTGGLPYGYRSVAQSAADGRTIGSAIVIDAEQSEIVRRVFALYLEGLSLSDIAGVLNREKVPSPRAHTRSKNKTWVASTIRAFLHNASYIGEWRYGARKWRKVPGTGKRRPTERDPGEVISQSRPHLRLIDEETWDAVQARLARVRACYTASPDGRPKGRASSGRATAYPFSGLLFCGACGAPMIITGRAYYYCSANRKRGTCTNALSVREDVARACLFEELRSRLTTPARIEYVRKRYAARVGELERTRTSRTAEGKKRLDRIEGQIAKLLDFVVMGGGSPAVADRLKALQQEAKTEKRALAEAEQGARLPVRLPTPEEILRMVVDLEQRLRQDPVRAREELATYFRDARIELVPQPAGFYVAKSAILPLAVLTTTPPQDASGRRYPAVGCAGRI